MYFLRGKGKYACNVVSILSVVILIYLQFRLFHTFDFFPKVRIPENIKNIQIATSMREFFSVSLIVPTRIDKLVYLNYHINSWLGEIVVPIAVKKGKESVLQEYKASAFLPSRVKIIALSTDSGIIQTNVLRNEGIRQCSGTHFVVTHMTQIPSYELYEAFQSLPDHMLEEEKDLFIIPEFSLRLVNQVCAFWYDCDENMNIVSLITKSVLKNCVQADSCTDNGIKDQNDYMFPEWYSLPAGNYSTPLSCWGDDNQDPTIIAKKSSTLPLFDTRLEAGDDDTLLWIVILHYSGYRFNVLSNGWMLNLQFTTEMYSYQRPAIRKGANKLLSKVKSMVEGKEQNALPMCNVEKSDRVLQKHSMYQRKQRMPQRME